jgi:hypothetical protein
MIQKNDRGQTFQPQDQTISFALKPETLKEIEEQGLLFHKVIARDPHANQLRVVVRDTSSGSLGSVTIPFGQLKM